MQTDSIRAKVFVYAVYCKDYTKKIDQQNLNIKTAGINLFAINKIFQIRVSNKKY